MERVTAGVLLPADTAVEAGTSAPEELALAPEAGVPVDAEAVGAAMPRNDSQPWVYATYAATATAPTLMIAELSATAAPKGKESHTRSQDSPSPYRDASENRGVRLRLRLILSRGNLRRC